MGFYIFKSFIYILAIVRTYYVNELSSSNTLKIETRYPLMASHESESFITVVIIRILCCM